MPVLLGLASLLCLLSVPLAGGRLGALAELRLRGGGFLLAGVALQVMAIELMPRAPEPVPATAHVVSYGLVGIALWCNRRVPFLWLIGLGGALNALAIAANGGVMPARAGALATAGLSSSGDAFENSAAVTHAHLPFLGDVFAVPAGWPAANVFSLGDVLIVVGLALLLHAWCGTRIMGPDPLIDRVGQGAGLVAPGVGSAHDVGGGALRAAAARGAGARDGWRGAGGASARERAPDGPRAHRAAG